MILILVLSTRTTLDTFSHQLYHSPRRLATTCNDWQSRAIDYMQRTAPILHRSFTDPSPILHRSFTVFKDLQCTTMQHIAFNASRGVRGYAAISSEGGDGGDE